MGGSSNLLHVYNTFFKSSFYEKARDTRKQAVAK